METAVTGVVLKKTLKLEKKLKFSIFSIFLKISKNKKIFKKQSKIRGEPPIFGKSTLFFEYFLIFQNFDNIENLNFFSSFKVFLKTTPVAHVGSFNVKFENSASVKDIHGKAIDGAYDT